MASSNCRVRRATLDDIKPLMALWQSMNFDVDELAKRTTEFQVAESDEGRLLGAVGLQIAERQGRIHSEAFSDFAVAELVRPMFWERIHSIATNHGLLRVWTQESAPFWNHTGLVPADTQALQHLPAVWRNAGSGWRTIKLKEDLDAVIAADKEFSLYMEAERQRTQRTIQQARIIKLVVTVLIFGALLLILGAAFLFAHRHPPLPGR